MQTKIISYSSNLEDSSRCVTRGNKSVTVYDNGGGPYEIVNFKTGNTVGEHNDFTSALRLALRLVGETKSLEKVLEDHVVREGYLVPRVS